RHRAPPPPPPPSPASPCCTAASPSAKKAAMSTTSAPADAVQAIEEGLARLGTSFRDAFASAPTEQALRLEYAKVLGKKGDLTAVLALMRNVAPADRPRAGA